MNRSVFLIGFMGAGKTTAARNLAKLCGLSSLDLDISLKRNLGISAGDLIRTQGEAVMRKHDTNVLKQVVKLPAQFISCGGGIVETPLNIDILNENGYVVYLKISTQEAHDRITNFSNRPLFSNVEDAQALHKRRLSKYEDCADTSVEVSGSNSFNVANTIMNILLEDRVLMSQ